MNAFILAAGIGLRMKEISRKGHKALLPIGGISIVERIIHYLHEAGIFDITIVTGHKKRLFEGLKETYNVKLIHNHKYATNNNLQSIELILDELADSFIIHADVVLFKNIFKHHDNKTMFYTILKESKGVPLWYPKTDKTRRIIDIEQVSGSETKPTFLGISYWTRGDADALRHYFYENIDEKKKRKFHLEWEEELIHMISSISIEGRQIDRKYAKDINLLTDYFDACCIYDLYWRK